MTTNESVVKAFVNNWEAVNTRNLSYDGVDTLTSYWTQVAKRHDDLILVDSHDYSITTTKQIGPVFWLGGLVIQVPDIHGQDHKKNIDHLESVIETLRKKHSRARKYDYSDQISDAEWRLQQYKIHFSL